ncbi:hypothetical protein A3K73_05775 [Candidatus Pacearchaeota archaeon RBG_13_36_9]|nr:MAG: hypothetical protein A3K73_05775 [Candidatus Pacearchaeota archaeon RBG_13_36_9]
MVSRKRAAIYIDGSNFYFSVKKTFNCKVDIDKFCKKLAGKNQVVKINYYISPVGEANPKMYVEQQRFFEKLKKIDKLKIVLGRLEKHKKEGKEFYVEKATDINLAQDLIFDAMDGIYDAAFLISNDGDFSGVVSSVIKRFSKEIIYAAIGNRKSISYHLKKVASSTLWITQEFIKETII